jgi:hypothetical protein
MNDGHSSFISGRGYWRRTHAQDGASDKFWCCMWIRRTRRESAGRLCLRITSCTNNVVFHWGPVTFVFRLIHCHQHASVNSLSIQEPSGQIVTNYSERLAGFLVLQSQRERARYLRLRARVTPTRQKSKLFLLSAPRLLLQSTSIVGAFASLQLCIMPTRATLRAAATARRSHARERV